MDYAEEQENELMALESIYMDDFRKLVPSHHAPALPTPDALTPTAYATGG